MNKYHSSSPITDENWTEHYDESLSAYYYYNNMTGISQWEKPENYQENNEIKKKPLIKKNKQSNSRIVPVDDVQKIGNFEKINSEEEEPDQPKQDYLGLAKIYKIQQPYRDYSSEVKCILCHKKKPTSVLYPCQHRCICDDCLESEAICSVEDIAKNSNGFCNCPLCGTIIKKILCADSGLDEEVYWKWVLEVNPPLPDDFMKNFRHSAAVIQKVYIDENIRMKQPQNCCLIS